MKRVPVQPRWLQRMRSRQERELRLMHHARASTVSEVTNASLLPGYVTYLDVPQVTQVRPRSRWLKLWHGLA